MKTMRKLAILESLDAMDHIQMERVLRYIKELLQEKQAIGEDDFRRQAMQQIQRALRSEKGLKLRV